MILENGKLRLELETRDGGELWLTSFVHDGTGLLSGRTPLMAVNNLPVRTLALGGDSVRFERCGVEGEMRLRFAGTHLEMDIRLTAAEKTEVRLTVPILHFGVSEETVYFNPHTGGSLQNQAAQFKAIYGAEASICATFAYNPGHKGIGFGFYNAEQRRIVLENGPRPEGGAMCGVFERLQLLPGKQVTLPTLYLAPGENWADFLAPYRRFLGEIRPLRADTPDWVYDKPWRLVVLDDFIRGTPSVKGDDIQSAIDRILAQGESLGFEPVFFFLEWWRTCERIQGKWYFDHFQGDFTEARATVKEAVAHLKRKGAKCAVYVNVTAIGEYSDLFHRADTLLAKDHYGGYVRNWNYPMYMLCPDNEYTQAYWDRVMEYLFGEMGIDGIFLDQAGGGYGAPYCYNERHGHQDPDCYGAGMLVLLNRIRKKIRAIKADALIYGELAHDFRTLYVDYWLWHWFFGGLQGRGFGETLVWMKYVRPDAVFVEHSPDQSQPESKAAKLAGRGVWLNAWAGGLMSPGGAMEYQDKYWQAYREDKSIFHSEAIPLATDRNEVAAVMFAPDGAESIVALMQPEATARDVAVYLPYDDGIVLDIKDWPEKGGLHTGLSYDRKTGLTVTMRAEAMNILIKKTTNHGPFSLPDSAPQRLSAG